MLGYTVIIRDKLTRRQLNFYAPNEKVAMRKIRSKYPKCAVLEIRSKNLNPYHIPTHI